MRKKILAMILAGVLAAINIVPVLAAEVSGEETENVKEDAGEEDKAETEEEAAETVGEEATEIAETEIIIDESNFVDVDVIDLSLHSETSGEFTAVYAYQNPFQGKDTSDGVILEFNAKPTWEVHELGAIFAFNGSGEYDGKLYFSPGSYLGFNSEAFGGYYDANLFNYMIVTDYIKDGAKIRIELLPTGFEVYADDVLCYDQTILDDPNQGGGDFTSTSDFSGVLTWLAGADVLYFGYGSWWNSVGTNEANIDLSDVSFRLQDGTVVMDQLKVDKELVESLGGTVDTVSEEESADVEIAAVDVEIFDIDSVEYKGSSALPLMAAAVVIVLIVAVVFLSAALKKRTYDDI